MVAFIPTPTDPRFKDITGQKFGRWTVLGFTARRERGSLPSQARWLCRCECGAEREVPGPNLRNGSSTSCGCQRALSNRSRATHGAADTPLYEVWCGIRARCQNPNHSAFANYGGRGITLCERWSDFRSFVEDMGDRPSPAHSIERKDNDVGYEPSNCVWATRREQARNRRTNHLVVLNGKTMCLFDALAKVGLDNTTFYRRIARGWSESRALHEPVDRRFHRKV